jgi:hypothetical protein
MKMKEKCMVKEEKTGGETKERGRGPKSGGRNGGKEEE